MAKYKCIKKMIGLIGEPFHVGTVWERKFTFEIGNVYLYHGISTYPDVCVSERWAIIGKTAFKECFEKVKEDEVNE